MSIERLSDDYLTSLAGLSPPAPPAPPTPLPPAPTGFKTIGGGACRDASGVEPSFYTNKESKSTGTSITLAQCEAACTATADCGGISFCEPSQPACAGECHLYVPTAAPAPNSSIPGVRWAFAEERGHLPVTQVTSEHWWICYGRVNAAYIAAAASPSPPSTRLTGHVDLVKSAAFIERSVERLNQWVHGPGQSNVSSGVFGNSFVEAPAIFKRKSVYYALFGNCCCFCGHGSGIGVYTASHPLGPWSYHDNIGCTKPTTPGCGCGMNHPGCPGIYGNSLTKAQQNFVIQVPSANGTIQYIWTGDRWQSAADGVKAHDLQYWSVLRWQNDPASGLELPVQFVWEDTITFEL